MTKTCPGGIGQTIPDNSDTPGRLHSVMHHMGRPKKYSMEQSRLEANRQKSRCNYAKCVIIIVITKFLLILPQSRHQDEICERHQVAYIKKKWVFDQAV